MKALRITRIVLVSVAAAIVGLAIFLIPITTASTMATADPSAYAAYIASVGGLSGFIATSGFSYLLMVTGSIFLFSQNKVVRALGIGFTVSTYLMCLIYMVLGGLPFAYLLAAIGAIVYAVSWVFELILYIVIHADRSELEEQKK